MIITSICSLIPRFLNWVIGTGTLIHSFGSMNLSLVIFVCLSFTIWLFMSCKHNITLWFTYMPLYLAAKLQIKIERTKKKGEKLASFSLDYNELINVSQSITAILENLKCLSFLVNKTSAPTVIAELYWRISSKSGLSISNALYSSFSPEGATCTILQSFFHCCPV